MLSFKQQKKKQRVMSKQWKETKGNYWMITEIDVI